MLVIIIEMSVINVVFTNLFCCLSALKQSPIKRKSTVGIGRTRNEGKFESESQVHMTYEGEQGSSLCHWSTFCCSCRHFLVCTECVNYQCVNYQFFKMCILVQIKSPVFLTFTFTYVMVS